MIKKLLSKLTLFLTLLLISYSTSTAIANLPPTANYIPRTLSVATPTKEKIIFASLPPQNLIIKTSFQTADARQEIIRQYLHKYGSDLEPYANLIVELSDKYDFDYRWLVAIAQQESNLCKKIPENSYNCWGWGIYGDKVTRFDNYAHALNVIAPKFKETFLKEEHLKDPYVVMQTYTPPSDGSWAFGVEQFFKDLE